MWVQPDGDVYIACRDNYEELKVSLHGKRWRVGVTGEAAEKTKHLRPPGADRAWMTWDRPEAVDGIVMGFRVLFLPSELAVTPALRPPQRWREVEFIPPPPAGCVTIATVTLNEPGRGMAVGGAIDQYHRFLPLPTGGQLQLTLHSEPFGKEFGQHLAAAYSEGRQRIEQARLDVAPTSRMFLVGRGGSDDSPFAVEVNFHRPSSDPLQLRAISQSVRGADDAVT